MNNHSQPNFDPIFTFLNPIGGEIYKLGSTVGIFWKGLDPAIQITLSLIDTTAWVVVGLPPGDPLSAAKPNNGFFKWEFAQTLPIDSTHDYRFYIQRAIPDAGGQVVPIYGPLFKLVK